MTAPVWNGGGTDPWLPHRLNAALNVGIWERSVRRSIWAILSQWLVGTARRVARTGGAPNLDAIWARVPIWRDSVEHVARGQIKEAMGSAYRATMGPDFDWDRRPAAARYLAEVENRLVKIPDDVYDLVAGEIQEAASLGEGLPSIADRVDSVLSTTGSERWPNRATVIARTETVGALNAGRADAFDALEDELETDLEKVWLATEDSRTRPTHNAADGQRVANGAPFIVGGFALMFPGDPSGPAQEVIQCRCTMLLTEPGEDLDLSDRQSRRR